MICTHVRCSALLLALLSSGCNRSQSTTAEHADATSPVVIVETPGATGGTTGGTTGATTAEPPAEEELPGHTELVPTDVPCGQDSDCVKATCCHATTCVAASARPDCSSVACTADCRAGTMACNGGCVCDSGKCAAKLWFPPSE